jgi:hypothetical protein
MTEGMKIAHGTSAWFDMVGTVLMDAAMEAELLPTYNVCLVERYIDGIEVGPGLVQGLRFEIVGGKPFFRLGARHDEWGDVTVDVTKAASYTLNTLRSADPRFRAAFDELQGNDELKVEGDLSLLDRWFGVVHDRIVGRTS